MRRPTAVCALCLLFSRPPLRSCTQRPTRPHHPPQNRHPMPHGPTHLARASCKRPGDV
ncbi:hypothetical protein EXIGLDRAFT_736831 [Exidia glandulosa HHB12029]|uniref:Uncharacterized protein n=1 Tax=Exidia glandulosa HHB12029 TaxID=1314781 RepID=A0A166BL51_EXIGL|nr:hypothetical protein EXIGLDRAFT_736831 [Exidia glandulosa HHB12029]